MKIAICGSMSLSKRMVEIEKELLELGHEVVLPRHTHEYVLLNTDDHIHNESVKNKVEHDLIRKYFEEIKNNDAILVVKEDKNDVRYYIGGNSFLEMGFAHILNKPIFLLNPVPEMGYSDELNAMRAIVLDNDLTKIIIS